MTWLQAAVCANEESWVKGSCGLCLGNEDVKLNKQVVTGVVGYDWGLPASSQ